MTPPVRSAAGSRAAGLLVVLIVAKIFSVVGRDPAGGIWLLVANLIGAARAGMGVAVVQKCMVESDLRSGALVMPVQAAAETGRGYYLCRRRAQPAHAAADLFADWVTAHAHESLRADAAPRRPEKVKP